MKDTIFFIKSIMSFDGKINGNPYRIIAIESNKSLSDLAEAIVESFDFDFDHCYGFYDNIKNVFQSYEGYEYFADIGEESDFPGVEKTKIFKVYDELKKKMLFLFDYGDGWRFITQLVSIEKKDPNKKYPLIIEKVGDGPEQYPDYEEDYEDDVY